MGERSTLSIIFACLRSFLVRFPGLAYVIRNNLFDRTSRKWLFHNPSEDYQQESYFISKSVCFAINSITNISCFYSSLCRHNFLHLLCPIPRPTADVRLWHPHGLDAQSPRPQRGTLLHCGSVSQQYTHDFIKAKLITLYRWIVSMLFRTLQLSVIHSRACQFKIGIMCHLSWHDIAASLNSNFMNETPEDALGLLNQPPNGWNRQGITRLRYFLHAIWITLTMNKVFLRMTLLKMHTKKIVENAFYSGWKRDRLAYAVSSSNVKGSCWFTGILVEFIFELVEFYGLRYWWKACAFEVDPLLFCFSFRGNTQI